MTTTDLPKLVTDCIALDRQIADLTDRVNVGKSLLVQAAILEHTRTLGHETILGCTYTFSSLAGESANVNFPADKLISNFRIEGDQAILTKGKESIELGDFRKIAGEHFKSLFAKLYKPAKAFRELAPRLLTPGAASKLIRACEEGSSPRVSFKTKDPA